MTQIKTKSENKRRVSEILGQLKLICLIGIPEIERGLSRRNLWGDNVQKFSKIYELYQSTNPRSPVNSNQNKYKENHS